METEMLNEVSQFHIETPMIESKVLSDLVRKEDKTRETRVFLKLDNIQPSGSFKIRGVGKHILAQLKANPQYKDLVIASGGNAGLAASYAAWKLNLPIKVIVPVSSGETTIRNLKSYGAEVIVHGAAWDESDLKAHDICDKSPQSAYISPFEDPVIWSGHSTIVDEMREQLNGVKPDCIITAVGGGGLFNGVIEGLINHGWLNDVDVIAAETDGANCFNLAVAKGELVTMDRITSVAVCLGAKTCSKKAFEYYKSYSEHIKSVVVSDKEAVEACLKFLDDHKLLVELSCGAALAIAYNLNKKLEKKYKNVAVIVCGGTGISLQDLLNHKKNFNL